MCSRRGNVGASAAACIISTATFSQARGGDQKGEGEEYSSVAGGAEKADKLGENGSNTRTVDGQIGARQGWQKR